MGKVIRTILATALINLLGSVWIGQINNFGLLGIICAVASIILILYCGDIVFYYAVAGGIAGRVSAGYFIINIAVYLILAINAIMMLLQY